MAIVPVFPRPHRPADSEDKPDQPLTAARRRVGRPSAPQVNASDLSQASKDYVVGYGRPPIHTRFKAGQSGNPKGRPKGARGLNTLARELLTARVSVRTASGEKRMNRIEAALLKTYELALKGNPRALSQVLALYSSAVPETGTTEPPSPIEELTVTDLAILEEFKASLLREDLR